MTSRSNMQRCTCFLCLSMFYEMVVLLCFCFMQRCTCARSRLHAGDAIGLCVPVERQTLGRAEAVGPQLFCTMFNMYVFIIYIYIYRGFLERLFSVVFRSETHPLPKKRPRACYAKHNKLCLKTNGCIIGSSGIILCLRDPRCSCLLSRVCV